MRSLPLIGVAGFALLAAQPAFAQDAPESATEESESTGENAELIEALDGEREVDFEANEIRYDEGSDTVTAQGDVILEAGDQSVRAERVVWNRMSGEIVAEGSIRFVDADGNQLFTERLVLTDRLEAAAMSNLLLVFREGSRLAANEARRNEEGDIALDKAAFSTCSVINEDGCPKSPSWRVTAERVYYDRQTQRIRFRGAYLELFGTRLLPLPGLSIRADGSADSGFFIPEIELTASNGVAISDSFYWRMAENRDLELTGYIYTATAPMVSAKYRQLTDNGAFQITGYATYGSRLPLTANGEPNGTSRNDIRGYIAGNGRFQFNENLSLSGSLRYASDRTFLRRYDISRDDRIRSTVALENIDDSSYLSVAGWATQLLLVNQDQGQVPIALPLIDYRKRLADPVLGGTVELQGNTLAITRTDGQDTQRAFARAQWNLRKITPLGQEVSFTALVRGDVYHSDQNDLTSTALYAGTEGWQTRGVAMGAIDIKWPLIGEFMGGTQTITPRVQFVAAPSIRNLAIPNEDARAIDLEDSNLFALNRFPGYDRVEDGARMTYGADWQLNFPGWRISSTIGQSYRLSNEPVLFPDGTGLTERFSDFVGRTEVRYRDFLKLVHRFRLDKDNLTIRRAEVDATLGSDRTYVELGYLRLNRNIQQDFEDLQDREELRLAGRIAFANYWSVFGSAVVNLTDAAEDPTNASDGFEPLRTRLGIAYADDCLEMGFTWRRDYIELADARSGNSFQLYFSLRNLSFR